MFGPTECHYKNECTLVHLCYFFRLIGQTQSPRPSKCTKYVILLIGELG